MKRIRCLLLIIISFVFMISYEDVFAYTYESLKNYPICNNYELGIANADGSITRSGCYGTYETAKSDFDGYNQPDQDNIIMMQRYNGYAKVIDARYALVSLDIGNSLTSYYSSDTRPTNDPYLYMNHNSNYGGVDGAFIMKSSNGRALIKTSGTTGWVLPDYYKIIPLNWVKNSSYYYVKEDCIIHHYVNGVDGGYEIGGRTIGPKPSNLEVGGYYSYDGNYFYTSLLTMLKDYKAGTFDNAINKDNPYYNYYTYLPHRTKTTYSSINIDEYFRTIRNPRIVGNIYGRFPQAGYSLLYGVGGYFTNAQNLYGVNAISMLALSMNETAIGTSSIAIDKSNLFGHSAYDGSAYTSADGYLDARSSINSHANTWISNGYSNIEDWRYRGGHFGNKGSGMNVLYASDPFWGDKAASYYYWFDYSNGMNDYNYYQLGMITDSSVNIRNGVGTSFDVIYQNPFAGAVVTIIEEVEGEEIDGNNVWYKVLTDVDINDANYTISNWNTYNWEGYAYIHSSYVKRINDGKKNEDGSYHSPSDIYDYEDSNYLYQSYSSGTSYTPLVGKVLNNANIYYEASLTNKLSEVIIKDSLVTIFEKVTDGENDISYLINTDYGTNQKHWINVNDVELVEKDYAKVIINSPGQYLDVLSTDLNTNIGTLYTNTFPVVLDYVDANDTRYLKIQYNLVGESNKYGYIPISTNKGTITYTLNYVDYEPTLSVSDKSVLVGIDFNPYVGVSARDREDGDITSSITCDTLEYDKNTPGEYKIVYSVTDSYGHTVSQEVKLTVFDYVSSKSIYLFNSLNYVNDDIFEFSGFLAIQGMDNLNPIQNLVFVNQEDNTEYSFSLNNWASDYPYEVSSLDDDKAYNYNKGWFKSNINLNKSNIKQGDYTLYLEVRNENYKSRVYFTNLAYIDMVRRVNTDNRGFYIESCLNMKNMPIIMSIRDSFLLAEDEPISNEPMYNYFTKLILDNDNLLIRGSSHSVGVDYGSDSNVSRKLVFENTLTFERFSYDIDYITDGDYEIELRVSDNLDKTKAWFEKNISLLRLSSGTYAIYIKTTSNDYSSYGELLDLSYTDFTSINSTKYTFSRNEEKRLRVELTVD